MNTQETPIEATELFKEQVKSREITYDKKNYVLREVMSLLIPERRTRTYSSKGMNEKQLVKYLIKETQKVLFPDGEKYFENIIRDEYKDIPNSEKDILEVLGYFVKWVDVEKNF